MKVDIDHVLFWMDAIRNSNDTHRTLESFWKGQVKSKIWLIDSLKNVLKKYSITSCNEFTIDIHGGWNGVLASLLFQSEIPISMIRSVDIDPVCEQIAYTINKIEEIDDKFKAITADMCTLEYTPFDIVINTSCEHISQDQYNEWLSKLDDCLIILQSNNYNIPEHVRLAKSLDDFKMQSNLDVFWEGEKEFPLYTRYMIIGRKNV